MFGCNYFYALPFAVEISDRPEIAIRFKTFVTDPCYIEQISHWRVIIPVQAHQIKNLRLSRHCCD